MSSESDHPRQRTVAELLAAHGNGTVTGRRARRRAAEDAAGGGQAGPGTTGGAYPTTSGNGAGSARAANVAEIHAPLPVGIRIDPYQASYRSLSVE